MLRGLKQAFTGKLTEEWGDNNGINRIASKTNLENSCVRSNPRRNHFKRRNFIWLYRIQLKSEYLYKRI